MYKLSTNPNIIIRKFDNAHIPKDELNPDYLVYLEWIAKGNEPDAALQIASTPINPKLAGIEFNGVMCSATKEDQDGLLAVLVAYQLQGSAFQETEYRFINGSTLKINKDNINDFIAAWIPFRQSFFIPKD